MTERRNFIAAVAAALTSWACTTEKAGSLFAVKGDGRVDDTAQLQAALNRGGHITLEKGRRYRVSAPAGAKTALVINSDTFLDLAGAILELAPRQGCSLMATPIGIHNRNIRIAGGQIVGNGSLQSPKFDPNIGFTPTLRFSNCDGLELRDLRMLDTYMYSVHAQGNDCRLDNVTVDGAVGGGIHLNGARWQIDRVRVRDVTYFDPVNCQGNPFIVSLRDSTVGSVQCENYGFGIKFQDGCENLTIKSIVAIGGANNNEFLIKIQGMKDSRGTRLNRGIKIESIVARHGPGAGLYMIYCDGVDIASYQGENNGRSPHQDFKNDADVIVIDSDHLHFGRLSVKGYNRCGLGLYNKVGHFSVDALEIEGGKDINAVPMVLGSALVSFGSTRINGVVK